MVGSEGFLSFLETCCQQVFGRAGNFPFPLLAIFFPEQRACSQAKLLGKMKFQVRCRRGLYRLTRGGFLISLSRRIKVYPRGGGGGYLRKFWVGMCRWVPGTLSLYQSSFKWILLPYTWLNSQNSPLSQSSRFPGTIEVTNTVQPKQNRFEFSYFWLAIPGFPSLDD